MEDILKEINFEKFDNSQNIKIKEKLYKIQQRKFKMDKLVENNIDYESDKNSNDILIDNLDSCFKDQMTILKKIEFDVEDNFTYLNKMNSISDLFDRISETYDQDKKSKIAYLLNF